MHHRDAEKRRGCAEKKVEVMDLTNKSAIVTGGTRGIGRAIAKALVSAGVKVAITARNEDDIANAVSELSRDGAASGYVCDVRDYDQVRSVFAEIGGVERLIQQLQTSVPAGEAISLDDKDFAELKEEYPELAEVTLKASDRKSVV